MKSTGIQWSRCASSWIFKRPSREGWFPQSNCKLSNLRCGKSTMVHLWKAPWLRPCCIGNSVAVLTLFDIFFQKINVIMVELGTQKHKCWESKVKFVCLRLWFVQKVLVFPLCTFNLSIIEFQWIWFLESNKLLFWMEIARGHSLSEICCASCGTVQHDQYFDYSESYHKRSSMKQHY